MDGREVVESWFRRSGGRFFDLRLFGRPAAGSVDEGQHCPTGLDVSGNVLVLRFNVTDVLTITGVQVAEAADRGGLSIPTADGVRFEWYYPGLAEEPENRCSEEYRVKGETLERRFTGPIAAHFEDEELPWDGKPAVVLA
jgi:hypothetical protein